MWTVSCNLLNTTLTVKNRMGTEQFYVCPFRSLTDWELLLRLPSIMREAYHISPAWKRSKLQSVGLLVQDGRAEERVLLSSFEIAKITTTYRTTVHRRVPEHTKRKDSPCPKTKKKPQQDGSRSTITIKSNPIPAG